MTVVVAIDFGATSIRVCRVELGEQGPHLSVVHRYAHTPVDDGQGGLRWDWERLVAETERGLERAVAAGSVASIGVDTWGVDYGLVDDRGELLSAPHCYRSARTNGYREVVERIGEERLYAIAGVQLQPFNTIYQLAVHDRDECRRARSVLLLPDLLAVQLGDIAHLGADARTELTAAGTTGLLDLVRRDWSDELIEATGVPRRLFGELARAGEVCGAWRGIPIYKVGGHDTASAVAAMGAAGGACVGFVATGTWLLAGREQREPDVSPAARGANFTNEIGVDGGIRFLKNIAGFWMLNECRRQWGEPPLGALLREASQVDGESVPVFDAADPAILAPDDMESTLRGLGGLEGVPRPVLVRSIFESMAATTVRALDHFGGVEQLCLFGGGANAELLEDALARRTGASVIRGPVEAAAIGNALVQGIALGVYPDLAAARKTLTP